MQEEKRRGIEGIDEQNTLATNGKSLSTSYLDATGNLNEIQNSMRMITESALHFITVNNSMMDQLCSVTNEFLKGIAIRNSVDFSGIVGATIRVSAELDDIVKKIIIPTISERRKSKLIEAHKRWGELGWTINPCSGIDTLYDVAPEGKKEADKLALKYCSKEKMEQIFAEIKECRRIKNSDFDEATFGFRNKQYKSCALILISLIEAQLIRLQKKSALERDTRKVGIKAVKAVEKRTEEELNTQLLFTALFCQNLFSCLKVVFQNGNDFRIQPEIINRNFLAHGMLTRRVTRKDCVQLFLLYYNVLELLDMIFC